MSTAAPRIMLQIGQTVRRRLEPQGAVGVVVGLVFVEPSLALVRWSGTASTFELEDSLVDAFSRRR
jgi:hypothetical protein